MATPKQSTPHTYAVHPLLGTGVVTSRASESWVFVKFVAYSGSRMCQEGRLQIHEPTNDDGAMYCGWTGDAGTIRGCGHAWPCPTVRAYLED